METRLLDRASTGVPGLDEILHGGLIPGRVYLVRGAPGTGKTTLCLHFLAAGASVGEKTLYITLAESEEKLRANAAGIGFDLAGVDFLDLSPRSALFSEDRSYDIFSPAEIEREPITRRIVELVSTLKPSRICVDPTTQMRYLAQDPYQFRRQALSFLRFLAEREVTVLWTSEAAATMPDDDLQFTSDGVINMSAESMGRSVSVSKFLGSGFYFGRHSMEITPRGLCVFPRLLPEPCKEPFVMEVLPSGIPVLDEMLHGGIEQGTITIISGPSGVGKTTLGLCFLSQVAANGGRGALYQFEEETAITLRRCDGIGLPARQLTASGALTIKRVEPLRFSPDEFAQIVRRDAEDGDTKLVVLDNVSGYRLCLRGEDLIMHLHALSKYLQSAGLAVVLINEIESIAGEFRATEVGISYIADNILFLRYYETLGEMHRAICVLKKRITDFDHALREMRITSEGIKIGEPLVNFRGVLRGSPEQVR